MEDLPNRHINPHIIHHPNNLKYWFDLLQMDPKNLFSLLVFN
nr:MAG TPA: hypothetical protein [Caudoviricetes sp.]